MHAIISVIDHVSEQDNQIEGSNYMDNVDDEISGMYIRDAPILTSVLVSVPK